MSGRRTEMYLNSSCMDRDVMGRPEAQSNGRSGVLPGLRFRPPGIETFTSASVAVRAAVSPQLGNGGDTLYALYHRHVHSTQG